ncbi:MAG: class II aldolase/adducin family protein [Firmicutes bacterium]|nr:class II aldolase/adducin family protein [Bacillota bacterium]
MDVAEDIQQIKENLAQAVRVLANGGILTLMVGHVSQRVKSDGSIVILGHAHRLGKTLSKVAAGDMVTIDMNGNLIDGRLGPPGERFIHTAIYRARPDVGAVIHAHPLASLPFGIAGVEIIPVFARAVQLGPKVPIFDYPGQIDTEAKGEELARNLGPNKALLLRGHGIVVVGETLEEACVNAFMLEMNADIQFKASLLGSARPVTPEEVYGENHQSRHTPTSSWFYFVERYNGCGD